MELNMADEGWLDWQESAPPPPNTGRATVAKLEATIAELRAQLEAAAPRLDAFSRLEDLARERRSTPEAVAVQVTIDVLEEDRRDLAEEVRVLTEDRAALADEISDLSAQQAQARGDLNMLTEQRDTISVVVEDAETRHAELLAETTMLLEELESIRADGVRLLGEKAALEREVQALRDEAAALRDGEALPGAARRADDDPVWSSPTVASAEAFEVDLHSEEATAFDKFFEVDVGKDKARAWMLK